MPVRDGTANELRIVTHREVQGLRDNHVGDVVEALSPFRLEVQWVVSSTENGNDRRASSLAIVESITAKSCLRTDAM